MTTDLSSGAEPGSGANPSQAATALLEIRGLQVSYPTKSGSVTAVAGVDLSVRPGEILALVGESGSGKSTTALATMKLLPPGARIGEGEILFRGNDLLRLRENELRRLRGREIGLIPQDPSVSLNPVRRIGDQIAEVLRIHDLARGEQAQDLVIRALTRAGMPDPALRASQYPHQLSGGMRQRALIAMALVASPDLIVADEPTSALDVTVQRRILDHLEDLSRTDGLALLLVTHDLGVAADRAHRVAVMSNGVIVESGEARQVLEDPTHPYTRQLVGAIPGRRRSTRAAAPRATAPQADRNQDSDTPRVPLLDVRGLTKDFPLARTTGGSRTLRAVDNVSFTLNHGEALAIVGESGSGKSTTARLVLALEKPTAGSVHINGTNISTLRGAPLRALRRRVQTVYQNPFASLDPRFTVSRIIEEPLRAFRTDTATRADRRARVTELLDLVELPPHLATRHPAHLSGGQRQRVAIARALAPNPELLICDEPVSALDASVQSRILTLLSRLSTDLNLTCLFITHDLPAARDLCDHVLVMHTGHIVEAGPTDRVFEQPEHEYTRELLAAVPGGWRALA
ncbi:ABC transporter ATP-binding protein [Catenulispora yoronensis]|uniref:ABC transporter ATP-binding protein n=1 Tax=Catenulispora yoronensis TaxID=450799 RepID=A0ABN2U6D4_9ACTN